MLIYMEDIVVDMMLKKTMRKLKVRNAMVDLFLSLALAAKMMLTPRALLEPNAKATAALMGPILILPSFLTIWDHIRLMYFS